MASAPPTISINSLVMAACRALFITKVSWVIISLQLLWGLSMAVIRAAYSLAEFSRKAWYTWLLIYLGSRYSRNCSMGGSKRYSMVGASSAASAGCMGRSCTVRGRWIAMLIKEEWIRWTSCTSPLRKGLITSRATVTALLKSNLFHTSTY